MSHPPAAFSLNDYLFGPLGKEYCFYFYVLAVLGFFITFFLVVSLVIAIFNMKKLSGGVIAGMAMGIVYPALFYLQNRLLHSMCIHSEQAQMK
jgi:hypothetical protein